MSVELRLPNINAKDSNGKIEQLLSYIYQLVEELNYHLNLNKKDNSEEITKELSSKVEEAEENIAELNLLSNQMVLKVYTDSESGKQKLAMVRLDDTGEKSDVILTADSIALEGVTTIDNRITIDEEGYLHINSELYSDGRPQVQWTDSEGAIHFDYMAFLSDLE